MRNFSSKIEKIKIIAVLMRGNGAIESFIFERVCHICSIKSFIVERVCHICSIANDREIL